MCARTINDTGSQPFLSYKLYFNSIDIHLRLLYLFVKGADGAAERRF